MKTLARSTAGALAILVLGLPCLAQELTMPNTGYSVQMPGAAECSSSTVDTILGKQEIHLCSFFDREAGVGYAIQYVPIPDISRGKDPGALLEGGRSGAAVMTNSEVVRETKIVVDGYPGLETLLQARDGSTASLVRFVLTDRHLVLVSVVGIGDSVTSATAHAYVESVRIKGRAPGK